MPIIRQAIADDIEALASLRVAFFAEIGDITDEQHAEAFRQATHQYLNEALPRGTFLAWVAEEDEQIVGTSGLIFFEQAPTPTNLVGNEGKNFLIFIDFHGHFLVKHRHEIKPVCQESRD